ncbi:MAG: GEGP motif-containing diheme protein [Coriobacteriia bacterium]|nr:GEGP motif-containing diheme protein [Coriobacteriia bacterium]
MKRRLVLLGMAVLGLALVLVATVSPSAQAAYRHAGEMDSDYFLTAHPEAEATKLDSCTLCHRGGTVGKAALGSCEWCHYTYGYDEHGDITNTLNPYGMDYRAAGSDVAAVAAIDGMDSDGDGYSNNDEIAAVRYPGDAGDDPTKVEAPYRVYTLAEIEAMPSQTQFQLMNTHKSGDYYAEYTGVPMEYLLDDAGMLSSATGIDVLAADGFGVTHPLDPTTGWYHVRGVYPQSTFYYDEEADKAINPFGWCDYSALSVAGRTNGDPIVVNGGSRLLLAYKYEGQHLTPGSINSAGKLLGEGPFRVVPPQRVPGPPDQASTSLVQDVIWPFDAAEITTDHNAGFSSKCVTVVKVGPLPAGTTDIDTLEAGWEYVRDGKVVVYGAIDPVPTVLAKGAGLLEFVESLGREDVRSKNLGRAYEQKISAFLKQVDRGAVNGASNKITSDLLPKVDGVVESGAPDGNDWVTDPGAQRRIYWSLQELLVLLSIEG